MSAFHPKPAKPVPMTETAWLTPQRVRPAHWTEADLADLPKPVDKPDLTKGRFMITAPLAFPAVAAYGFFLLNNATGIYNDRMKHLRPY
jgi:hypothetical protein